MGHDMDRLENRLREFDKMLRQLVETDWVEELILVWRQPGWTTPAEFLLVEGLADAIVSHGKTLLKMQEVLVTGSREVGIG
jgi:hypothetical protein